MKIISGKLKSRKINIKKNNIIRPTTCLMRKVLFEWLSKYIKQSKCLDCFSGSGILSIESISRNAKYVISIEKNFFIYKNILNNIKNLSIKNIKVINTNILNLLKKPGKPYDIIFLDPPFYNKIIDNVIYFLTKNNWTKKNTFIFLEKQIKQKIKIPKNWINFKKKNIGQTIGILYLVKNK
ncbi:16S rRNA (guanine(966)-N(2))-methyltransferase RsmD [Buchnera aphidicola (Ceratovacuna keduensis)]|uniref:16S rRNA (guanine(966)-N(2))-methyltransferase RsmD n=1 Tax=Buchnera aphidicola TaxID=9 RepID=UPI0031B87F3C